MKSGTARVMGALLLLAALAGALREVAWRLTEVGTWRRGPAELREKLLYGPYREVVASAKARVSPSASVLLVSDWDPALLPYYLYPRRIYQLDVAPETDREFMKLPPSPYPRRGLESFAVDWVIRLRNVDGALLPEFQQSGGP